MTGCYGCIMLTREEIEQREAGALAPYAARSVESLGREHAETEDSFRAAFQRDRDRIIHSEAFRRLEYKTQVFVNHEGDYYRTRLTHTLEVSQLARGLCRTFRLNEDLAEAIALAHDLGHTPFGHRGEEVLHRLMKNHGGFEHNSQSYRIVTLLEHRYPEFPGLNLTYEVREGIAKHSGEYDNPHIPAFSTKGFPSLEAQVVDVADQIAYLNHDLDDGLESGMLSFEQLEQVQLWREVFDAVTKVYPNTTKKLLKYQTIRRLIHLFVTDIHGETLQQICERKLASLADVRARGERVVRWSDGLQKKTRELLDFLYENLYHHQRVERMAKKSERILTDLFGQYTANVRTLPQKLYTAILQDGHPERHVCDYIAGMTDRFALDEHAKLFDPQVRV